MAKILVMPGLPKDVPEIPEEMLERMAQYLHMRAIADAAFMADSAEALRLYDAGARPSKGSKWEYHRNLGVKVRSK
jgi:hypothetical protein